MKPAEKAVSKMLVKLTTGRRAGERHCVEAQRWALESVDAGRVEHIFKVSIFVSCKISRNLFYILTMSLPEMVLYPITFLHITIHNNQVSISSTFFHAAFTRSDPKSAKIY